MATDWKYKLTGNYYIVWLSRCDDAWRWLLSDRGPYTPMHVLKKQHHADCQRIAKEMLLTQLADKMQSKKLGLKNNPRRGTTMKRQYFTPREVQARLKAQGVPPKAFWELVGGGDLAPVLKKDLAGIIREVKVAQGRNPRRYRRNRLGVRKTASRTSKFRAMLWKRGARRAQSRGDLRAAGRMRGYARDIGTRDYLPLGRNPGIGGFDPRAYARTDPRKAFSAGWYGRHYPESPVSEAERRRHNEKVLAELRARRRNRR